MSGEMMMFPDTVEEFMEQHKMVDSDQVYSNGVEFVPIFRMRQWFEHQHTIDPVVRCKDCYHYCIVNQPYDEVWCSVMADSVPPDGYCYHGRRGEVKE